MVERRRDAFGRHRIPESTRGPLGYLCLGVGVLSLVLGYVLVLFGLTLRFDLAAYHPPAGQSDLVVAVGVVLVALAYAGWRGFRTLVL